MSDKMRRTLIIVLAAVDVLLSICLGAMYHTVVKLERELAARQPIAEAPAESPVTSINEPIARITMSAAGDILLAQPILDQCMIEDGYSFDYIFRHLAPYTQKANIAAVNLVTTLGGSQSTGYTGLPNYNSPDEIVQTLADCGFDAVLTANAHCYEFGLDGVKRTAETLHHAYISPVGTTYDKAKPTWKIIEMNGIHVGMMCYTQETQDSYPAMPSINGKLFDRESIPYVDTFSTDDTDKFLIEISERLAAMKEAGSEINVLFMSWGEEFDLTPNEQQMQLAQSLCDMGFDVILGMHAHVVQPIQQLTSRENAAHKALVCYCLGNTLSNQRQGYSKPLTTAHTEDGVLLNLTFTKYADGRVYTDAVNALPLWVNLHSEHDPETYTIIPLDDTMSGSWQSEFGLSDFNLERAKASYSRTMAILNPSLNTINAELAQDAYNRTYGILAEAAPTEPAETETTEAPAVN